MFCGRFLQLTKMSCLKKQLFFVAIFLLFCRTVSAQVVIDEIMYDVSGADSGREWIEIENVGSAAVAVSASAWKFFEGGTNHELKLFQGSASIAGFSGTIFDSAFSLSNSGETLAIKISSTTVADQVTYSSSSGGSGDGKSLQKIGSDWKTSAPTPGLMNKYVEEKKEVGKVASSTAPVAATGAVKTVSTAQPKPKPVSNTPKPVSVSNIEPATSEHTEELQSSTNVTVPEASPKPHSGVWLYALAGIIILGLGAVFLPKQEKFPVSNSKKSIADDYEIIED